MRIAGFDNIFLALLIPVILLVCLSLYLLILTTSAYLAKPGSLEAGKEVVQAQPNQQTTRQPQANTDANANATNEAASTAQHALGGQQKAAQPHYGWSLHRTTPYERASLIITLLIVAVTGVYAVFPIFNGMYSKKRLPKPRDHGYPLTSRSLSP